MGNIEQLKLRYCMISHKRNPAIELYRVLLMFGIVLLHCVCQGRYSGIWPRYLLGFCVPGFILITGYFGVKFSLMKTLALYGTASYACLLAPLVGGAWMTGNYWQEVLRTWDAEHGFWFIHAYVILTVLAPLASPLFDGARTWREIFKVVAPLLFVVFIWGALRNYNHLRAYIPAPAGLEGASFITFFGVYIVGRFIRVFGLGENICYRWKVIILILLVVLMSFTDGYFSSGNNPVCVLLAVVSFLVVKDIKLPSWGAEVVSRMSPYVFAIYCIHGTVYFPFTGSGSFAFIEWMKCLLENSGMPLPLTIGGAAVIVFLTALVLALPWRLACLLCRKFRFN